VANKKGLGRGLSSMINGTSYEEQMNSEVQPEGSFSQKVEEKINKQVNKTKNKKLNNSKNSNKKQSSIEIQDLNIDDVVPNPKQPRSVFNKEELDELSESIKKNGLLQPITVAKNKNDKYEIIAGERRWRAAKQCKLKQIPAIIKDVEENKKLELALIENLQRADLNPIEEAYCYRKIMEEQSIDQNELANKVSKGRSTITNSLRLLKLPESTQKLLYDNKISAGHARAILSVNNKEGQEKLTDKIVTDSLNVREAERLANLYSINTTKVLKTRTPAPPKSFKRVANVMSEMLNTQVKIKRKKSNSQIEITFKDEQDLERIYNIIKPD
jgi:ParB family transcriptional regulator, chromosome partitioning protein